LSNRRKRKTPWLKNQGVTLLQFELFIFLLLVEENLINGEIEEELEC
jgi:hypothetical protein